MHLLARDLGAEVYHATPAPAVRPHLTVATAGHKRVAALVDLLELRGLSQTDGNAYARTGVHVLAVNGLTGRLISRPAKRLLRDMLTVTDPEDGDYVDAALVGRDMLTRLTPEEEACFRILAPTGRGVCRMAVLVKEAEGLVAGDVSALAGRRIYTSYVRAVEEYLARHGVAADVVFRDGKEEFAVTGQRDACVCMYESGRTAQQARLVVLDTVLDSEFVLVARCGPLDEAVDLFARRLRGDL